MNRASIRSGLLLALFGACSDVQSVQLGEPAGPRAGERSATEDAAVAPPALDTLDSGTDNASMDPGASAADPTTPDASQPSAADAGANSPDARVDTRDIDDDDDEDSEESPQRPSDEEDAGEPSDD